MHLMKQKVWSMHWVCLIKSYVAVISKRDDDIFCIFTAANIGRATENNLYGNNLGSKLKRKRFLRGNLETAISSNNGLVQRKLVKSRSEASLMKLSPGKKVQYYFLKPVFVFKWEHTPDLHVGQKMQHKFHTFIAHKFLKDD